MIHPALLPHLVPLMQHLRTTRVLISGAIILEKDPDISRRLHAALGELEKFMEIHPDLDTGTPGVEAHSYAHESLSPESLPTF